MSGGRARRLNTCFVMMPFGVKEYPRGVRWNFDEVFGNLIAPGAFAAGLQAERCDTRAESGPIEAKMIEMIYSAPFVIADITGANPNVMYELGVRHALCPMGTLIVRGVLADRFFQRPSARDPFNIEHISTFEYKRRTNGAILTTPKELEDHIRQVRANRTPDSLVHSVMPDLRTARDSRPIPTQTKRAFRVIGAEAKCVGFITGDIKNIKNVDYWVNSENTHMEMSRPFERSVSATIRALGATFDTDENGAETGYKDAIGDALSLQMGPGGYVHAATVKVTEPGALAQRNGVRAILHVASVRGAMGKGYEPVVELEDCVANAIEQACKLSCGSDEKAGGKTLLIPLIGTGQARGEANAIALRLVEAAAEKLLAMSEEGEDCPIEAVYFLAYTERDEQILTRVTHALTPRAGANRPLLEPMTRG